MYIVEQRNNNTLLIHKTKIFSETRKVSALYMSTSKQISRMSTICFTRVNIDLYKMTLQEVLAVAGSASVYGASLP